jgi:hypothetical protein
MLLHSLCELLKKIISAGRAAGSLAGPEGEHGMRRIALTLLTAVLFAGGSFLFLYAQQENCKVMDAESSHRFLPDRVPMESESIQIDSKNSAGIQFPNQARIAIAVLVNSGLSKEMQQKYQYVFVSEARVRLDRWSIPAGMVGLGPGPSGAQGGQTLTLTARDFLGAEIETIVLNLDPNATDDKLSMTPKGPTAFELRIGKYVIQGTQR